MSIRSKKFISYIPFVNILVIPILWFAFYFKNPIPKKNFIKCILKCFMIGVAITIPRIIIFKIFGSGSIDTISTYVGILLTMFLICFTMIKDEENILKMWSVTFWTYGELSQTTFITTDKYANISIVLSDGLTSFCIRSEGENIMDLLEKLIRNTKGRFSCVYKT